MRAIRELEAMGYTFTVDGDKLRATCDGDLADADKARSLLGYVKRHRAEALAFLRERSAFEVQAEALLARCADTDPATWAQEWAELHDRWGAPCFGFPTWAAWAADVAVARAAHSLELVYE